MLSCINRINNKVLEHKTSSFNHQGLTHLNLNGCSRLSKSCLSEILPTLQSLRSLQLTNCRNCSDELLHKLGKYCLDLQELVIKLCPKITDKGIQAFFTPKGPNKAGCFSIIHLDVSGTSVTTKSLGVILLGLPKLRKLCFSDVPGENHLGLVGIPLLNIEHLDLFGTFLVDSDLKLLIQSCLKLVLLRLNLSSNLGTIVTNHLTSLSYLKSLDLGGASETLFEDVERFLEKRGGQLESLNLSGMPNVRISVLCIYCQSLKELVLEHCQNVDPILPTLVDSTGEQRNDLSRQGSRLSDFCSQLFYISLNFATFRDNGERELSSVRMSNILTDHPNLTRLSLKDLDVNDEVLEQVCRSSSSLALRTLDLTHCDVITIESVSEVVKKCQNLRRLDLSHCKQIDSGFISQLKKNLKKTPNPLEITWV